MVQDVPRIPQQDPGLEGRVRNWMRPGLQGPSFLKPGATLGGTRLEKQILPDPNTEISLDMPGFLLFGAPAVLTLVTTMQC